MSVSIPRVCEWQSRSQEPNPSVTWNTRCLLQTTHGLSRTSEMSGILKNASVQGAAVLSDGILSPNRALLAWWAVRWWVTPHLSACWACCFLSHTGDGGGCRENTIKDLGGSSGNQTLLLVQLQFEFKSGLHLKGGWNEVLGNWLSKVK